MKIYDKLFFLVLLLVLAFSLFADEKEEDERDHRESVRRIREILNLEPNKPKEDSGKNDRKFVFVPIAFYAPETGTGLGASVVYFRERNHQLTDHFTFTGFGTQEEQAIVMAQFDGDIFDKTRMKFLIQGKHFPESFYGIGNDTRSEDEESFLSLQYGANLSIMRKLLSDWSLGPSIHFFSSDIKERDDDGMLRNGNIEGSDTYKIVGLGISTDWDTRDNIYFASKGLLVSWDFTSHHKSLGSDYNFAQSSLDMRKFITLARKHILALQLISKNSFGEVPFLQLYKLGGIEMLRGYHQTRFRDRNYLSAQLEYRFPIYRSFGGDLFGAIGDVYHDLEELNLQRVKLAAGMGLRYRLEKTQNLNLRIDFAINNIRRIPGISSEDDTYYGIYVALMEAF